MFTSYAFLQRVQRAYGPDTAGFDHAVRVARYAETESEEKVALCHDLVEDGHATWDDLITFGLDRIELDAVTWLTRPSHLSYERYIRFIINTYNYGTSESGTLALHVKFFDLVDHLHPRGMSKKHAHKITRYLQALHQIEEVLAEKEEGWD